MLDLEIDERALVTGQVRVSRLSAILPDGTPLQCEDGKPGAIPPRTIEQEFLPHLSALDVYVALVRETDGAPNTDLDGSAARVARHVRVQGKVADANTGMDAQTIDFAEPIVRVLVGDEVQGSFDAVRLAQLVRSPAGLQVRPTFVPPVLRVKTSGYMMQQLRNLLAIMTRASEAFRRAVASARQAPSSLILPTCSACGSWTCSTAQSRASRTWRIRATRTRSRCI